MAYKDDNIPLGEKLRILYAQRKNGTGKSWFVWLDEQMQRGAISMCEADELISHVYHNDDNRFLYHCVMCLRLYQRLDKPVMIERLLTRAPCEIQAYLI